MLATLCIENFAIVKHLESDFFSGMTAFTGETGAGKSIMIDALTLALGARADASVVRPGEEKCDITASFLFDKDSEPALWLAQHDIEIHSGEIFLRRIIYAEGRSKSYINGQPFPLQKVKELSEKLVHIHGQHEHQTLMHHATHRIQLDRYAKNEAQLEEVANLYHQLVQVKHEILNLKSQDQQADKIKLLEFQIEELQALNVQEGEIQAMHLEHQMLHHAKEYIEYSQQAHVLLNGDDGHNVCSELNQIISYISSLPLEQNQIKSAMELVNSALIQCEEAASELQQFAHQVQLDPERLQEIEQRMSQIHNLARKYHVDANHLPKLEEELQEQLKLFRNSELRIEQLEIHLNQLTERYNHAALTLRKSREAFAVKLAQEVTEIIQKLGMPKGRIEVSVMPMDKMQVHGLDKVEYMVCTNPGMEPSALNKIASGGELSRISLAIQTITAQRGSTPTLLFDEVDVGIGGATAALVGQMLRQLGDRLQVFCVTHQPQVAAAAHNHFQVTKQSDNKQTITQIKMLQLKDKVDEIARMLGGLVVTDQTRSHAEELIQVAQN